jgi:prepilin-type N-terminal cleavage/methylation domain-containing protein
VKLAGVVRRQGGFTLIEIVVAIVIIAIAGVSIVGLTSAMATRSAHAMQAQQVATIANSYLQEAMSKPFAPVAGGGTRATHNDVSDYNGLNDFGARDHNDNPLTGLSAYQVQVAVTPTVFNLIPIAQSKLITVSVTDPQGMVTQLSSFVTFP